MSLRLVYGDGQSYLYRRISQEKGINIMFVGDDLCLCGHGFGDHFLYSNNFGCEICAEQGKHYRHQFQLDNLDYVERLAQEKGLV